MAGSGVLQAAAVVTVKGKTWWHCPNCEQKLAEIVGTRVVIRVGERLISLPSKGEPDQVCWRCGTGIVWTVSQVG